MSSANQARIKIVDSTNYNVSEMSSANQARIKIVDSTNYHVDASFYEFINTQVIPNTKVKGDQFWSDFAKLLSAFIPRNQKLLAKREELQLQIDQWHVANRDEKFDQHEYQKFLTTIGYLAPKGDSFEVSTSVVDDEIARITGPQLVVPVKNARFALNAANARWGSLYDALYGTDVISEDGDLKPGKDYNQMRGAAVIEYAKTFLDDCFPLKGASHKDVVKYKIYYQNLQAILADGTEVKLANLSQFIASTAVNNNPSSIVLKNNKLHIEIKIDRDGNIGSTDTAGVQDILLEAAITTIMDCEDSVAAVDSEDKIEVYSNWLGLMQGNLEASFMKGSKKVTRSLNGIKKFTAKDGGEYIVPSRSLMFVRNVGLLTTIDVLLDDAGNTVPEGIVDAVTTCLISSIDINSKQTLRNSKKGSIYIVKPKMHGPEEVQFSCDLFGAVEDIIGLKRNVVKIGIMDEERRTTVNLAECMRAAKERVVFINTGFLDRTGDEIHTSMEAGPFLPKSEIKQQKWIDAYENQNVDVGLKCGLQGRGQIGKGMWAMPDLMAKMMAEKISHPKAGANTAWVPSPTAAVLHAIHYHKVSVPTVQKELANRTQVSLADILTIPLMDEPEKLTAEQIELELDNNIQGILGYVVRWIDQGVGCSKVPDINDVGLMEDRATLRISSQLLANWLHHGICTEAQINETLLRMSEVVDAQNSDDPIYEKLVDNGKTSLAFEAAQTLVLKGREQPSGYTEPLLHEFRIKKKATQAS